MLRVGGKSAFLEDYPCSLGCASLGSEEHLLTPEGSSATPAILGRKGGSEVRHHGQLPIVWSTQPRNRATRLIRLYRLPQEPFLNFLPLLEFEW